MSTARRSRGCNGKPGLGETYSRADEALWDDAYLLKLFNEQLDNADAVKDTREDGQDHDHSVLSTGTESSEEEEEGRVSTSATSSGTAATERDVRAQRGSTSAKSKMISHHFSTLNGLPEDIQALVHSFYNAGFEAGRFIGRSDALKKCSRKRHR
ncbi:hypothetical protein NXY56_005771 [Leishmania guyanensis]|uniref:Uncharacterized protein n=1 Tax=Leishmania guyanensis TaxID=5670 RepID=A0A1E1J3U7_LEIGU|nr:hypothetical protein, conserved [Leishmania guyanensis]